MDKSDKTVRPVKEEPKSRSGMGIFLIVGLLVLLILFILVWAIPSWRVALGFKEGLKKKPYVVKQPIAQSTDFIAAVPQTTEVENKESRIAAAVKETTSRFTDTDRLANSSPESFSPSSSLVSAERDAARSGAGGASYIENQAKRILPSSIYKNNKFWNDSFARTQTTSKDTILDDASMLPVQYVGLMLGRYNKELLEQKPDETARNGPSFLITGDNFPTQNRVLF